jgi:hypothetical protein
MQEGAENNLVSSQNIIRNQPSNESINHDFNEEEEPSDGDLDLLNKEVKSLEVEAAALNSESSIRNLVKLVESSEDFFNLSNRSKDLAYIKGEVLRGTSVA